MDLRAYLGTLPRGGIQAFAKTCGISEVYLHQLAARQDDRQPSTALCVVIERESAGEVTRCDLRPDDYWLHWPDLQRPASPTDEEASGEGPRTPLALSDNGENVRADRKQGA